MNLGMHIIALEHISTEHFINLSHPVVWLNEYHPIVAEQQ
jgi:hypothetical protein